MPRGPLAGIFISVVCNQPTISNSEKSLDEGDGPSDRHLNGCGRKVGGCFVVEILVKSGNAKNGTTPLASAGFASLIDPDAIFKGTVRTTETKPQVTGSNSVRGTNLNLIFSM